MMEAETGGVLLESGGRGNKPRNLSGQQKLKRQGHRPSPKTSCKPPRCPLHCSSLHRLVLRQPLSARGQVGTGSPRCSNFMEREPCSRRHCPVLLRWLLVGRSPRWDRGSSPCPGAGCVPVTVVRGVNDPRRSRG